jgi:hypothetical protein
MKNGSKLSVFFIFCALLTGLNASAKISMLTDVLISLEQKYEVRFSYDHDLLKGVPVVIELEGADLNSSVEKLTEKTAFNFEFLTPASILVKPDQPGMNYKICGKITDHVTKETLPSVVINNFSKEILLVSNDDGDFVKYIRYIPGDSVCFNILGYLKKWIPLNAFASGDCIGVQLKQDPKELGEVSITAYMASGINYNERDNSIVIKPSDLGGLPGETGGDVFTSLEVLPGITTPDSKPGNLTVRGSTPDQTLILFDNIPIYHRGYYFGTISPFNPKVVNEISVYRSSYLSDKGGRVGGAIDIRTRQNVADTMSGSVSISTTDAAFEIDIPVIKNKSSLMIGARSSYPFWTAPKIDSVSNFVFQESYLQRVRDGLDARFINFEYHFNDLNLKYIHNLNKNHKFSLGYLRIHNDLFLHSEDLTENTNTKDTITMNNDGLCFFLESRWNSSFQTRLTVSKSVYDQYFSAYSNYLPSSPKSAALYRNTADDLNILFAADYFFPDKNFLQVGYDLHSHNLLYKKSSWDLSTGSTDITKIKDENQGYINTVFASYNIASPEKLSAHLGIRANYFSLSGNVHLEPRLGVNYKLNKNIMLKSFAGLYKQFVTQVMGFNIETIGGLDNLVWILADEDQIPVIKSSQVMAGAIYQKNSFVVDVEMYHKQVNDMTVYDWKNSDDTASYFYGSVLTYGVDVLVRKSFGRLNTWACYTLSKSVMDFDSIQAEPFYSIYDQTHVLDLGVTFSMKQFRFSLAWKYRTGLASLQGIRVQLISGQPSSGSVITGPQTFLPASVEEYADRFPAFHQMDISGMYIFKPASGKWNGSLGFSITNLYDQDNIIEQVVRQQTNGKLRLNRYSLGFTPNIALTISW